MCFVGVCIIKVVHCIHGLTMGGAETLVKNYGLAFDKNKIDLTILCFNRHHLPYEEILQNHNIKVIYISDYFTRWHLGSFVNKALNGLARYYYVRKFIRELAPDVIHVHLPISRYIRFAHPKKETKIIYTQHFATKRLFNDYPMEVKQIRWLIKNYYFRFIALNLEMKFALNNSFGLSNTIVLNNGIDFSRYETAIDKKAKKREIHITEDAFVIGHVGRLSKIKNHRFLLETFCYYRKYNSNSYLLLVGTGEDKDNIVRQANELNIYSNMVILENRDDVPELLQCMDVFVFPSISEGLGIAVIEAQVAGLTSVVSDAVPQITNISNLVSYKSLDDSPAKWAEYIKLITEKHIVPQYYHKDDWDIRNVIDKLENIYME